jgi:hypothetical protein
MYERLCALIMLILAPIIGLGMIYQDFAAVCQSLCKISEAGCSCEAVDIVKF